MAILGAIGWIAFKCAKKIWINFTIIRFISEDVYGTFPMQKRVFILLSFAWALLPFLFFSPLFSTIWLLIIAWTMRPVFMKSSPEVAYRLLFYTFLMGIILVFAVLGFFSFIAAMIAKREAVQNEKMEIFRRLDMQRNISISNGLI